MEKGKNVFRTVITLVNEIWSKTRFLNVNWVIDTLLGYSIYDNIRDQMFTLPTLCLLCLHGFLYVDYSWPPF